MSTSEQRARWRRQASWLTQLGLDDDEGVPVDVVEDLAKAALALLDEVEQLELDRAEARAWAWSDHHRELMYAWVSVAGNLYNGDPAQLPDWLASSRTPDAQDWWPTRTQT